MYQVLSTKYQVQGTKYPQKCHLSKHTNPTSSFIIQRSAFDIEKVASIQYQVAGICTCLRQVGKYLVQGILQQQHPGNNTNPLLCTQYMVPVTWYKKSPSSHRRALNNVAATYSPGCNPSTIGAAGLNFSVRDGKRWDPCARPPKSLQDFQSREPRAKTHHLTSYYHSLASCFLLLISQFYQHISVETVTTSR